MQAQLVALGILDLHGDGVGIGGCACSLTVAVAIGLVQHVDPLTTVMLDFAVAALAATDDGVARRGVDAGLFTVVCGVVQALFIDGDDHRLTGVGRCLDAHVQARIGLVAVLVSDLELEAFALAAGVGLGLVAVAAVGVDAQCAVAARDDRGLACSRDVKRLAVDGEGLDAIGAKRKHQTARCTGSRAVARDAADGVAHADAGHIINNRNHNVAISRAATNSLNRHTDGVGKDVAFRTAMVRIIGLRMIKRIGVAQHDATIAI